MNTLMKIRSLEERLSYASPKECGRIIKKLVKLRERFIREK